MPTDPTPAPTPDALRQLFGGTALNLMTALGIPWEDDAAKLCYIGGDFAELERKWRAASDRAHANLRTLLAQLAAARAVLKQIAEDEPETHRDIHAVDRWATCDHGRMRRRTRSYLPVRWRGRGSFRRRWIAEAGGTGHGRGYRTNGDGRGAGRMIGSA